MIVYELSWWYLDEESGKSDEQPHERGSEHHPLQHGNKGQHCSICVGAKADC